MSADTPFSPSARPGLGAVQLAAVLLVAGQQVIVSLAEIDVEPFLSRYDMYSQTDASPADYEAGMGMTYWVVARLEDGRTETCRVDRNDVERLSHPEGELPSVNRLLARCLGTSEPVRAISLEGRRRNIDWERWRMGGETRVPIGGPIPLTPTS